MINRIRLILAMPIVWLRRKLFQPKKWETVSERTIVLSEDEAHELERELGLIK